VARFLVRRLALTIPVLLGVATLVFSLIHFIPGDPAQAMLGETASQADVDALREKLGLDKPLLEQYGDFLRGVARGDLGTSLRTSQPVTTSIVERLPATLELAAAAMFVAIAFSIPLGIAAAVKRGTFVDHLATTISLLGISIPNFWLGPLLALVFAVELGWLPVSGRGTVAHLVLPAISLGAALAAILARMTRASLLEELREQYVGAARARGVSRTRAVLRHSHPGRDAHRAAVRRGADRRRHHRDDLRMARHRTAAHPVDRLPRLPAGAGLHSLHRHHLRRHEPFDGSRVRSPRSANQVRVMALRGATVRRCDGGPE
jgi:peptide/nickel transport system permease protein